MPALAVALVVLLIVLAISAALIGREGARLDRKPPPAVLDMDDVAEEIIQRLPYAVTAELSHRQVLEILQWSLEFIRANSMWSHGSSDHPEHPVAVNEVEVVRFVADRFAARGDDVSAENIYAVLDAQVDYFRSIGLAGEDHPEDGED